MSRIAKWKLETTKVKVVFRLQFNATHIPQTGWDKLFISFIPADSGKVTAKTTKASVRNGACKWADPIYETTRLVQDTNTKQYDEKLYKLVVAMGSPRSSLLGEADINLADYANASKPSTVALPLYGCDGTILHVTVQLLTSKTGFREFEQQREHRDRGLRTTTDLNSHEGLASVEMSSEETVNDHIDKVNARVRFKPNLKELPLLEEEVGLNEGYADSTVGFDGSSNTSGSLCAEKHDTSSTHEIDSLKSTTSGDLGGVFLNQSPRLEKGDPSDHRFLAQGTNDWVHGCGSDYSVDNDLASAYEENSRLRGCLEAADSSILDLKLEVSSLQHNADEIGVEMINFSQQLAVEISSGEELAKEVSLLKLECSKLKDDLEQQKNSKPNHPSTSGEASETDQDCLQDLQIRWLKGLFVMEDNIRQLQNKVCFGFHESEINFLHSDFEALLGVLYDLKQGTGQAISSLKLIPSEIAHSKEMGRMILHGNKQLVSGNGFDADLCPPEGMLQLLSIPDVVSHESGSAEVTDAMKGKILELLRELDESKVERESLARKMNQMECYYEALVQELEENQRQMLGEYQNLRNEHSICLYTISSTIAEMETVRQDMNTQALRSSEEKCKLDLLNEELERRATTAEAALKRARLNYSIAVAQLQKDLELLSLQVLSMFQANENLVRHAFVDSVQPCFQGNLESTQYQNWDSNEFDAAKVCQSQNQFAGLEKQPSDGDKLLEGLQRSLHWKEELDQKVEEEVCEMHLLNVYLDVFSRGLQEALIEASAKMYELKQQLELSTESQDLLLLKLQKAMDDIHSLNEYNATWIVKCNDMALRNQISDTNLQNITGENHLLAQKITELEAVLAHYRIYESKYQASTADRTELVKLLKNETLENGNLQNKISCLLEELKNIKLEFDELANEKENLQSNVNLLKDKLWNLLASHDKSLYTLSLSSDICRQDWKSGDLTEVVFQLEELQHNACEKILQLTEEKKCLVNERDMARASLTIAETDISVMRKKFESDTRVMVNKLDVSNNMVQQLQSEIEAIGDRLNVSVEAEEKYMQQHKELLSDFDHLEVELQQLTSKNCDLAQEISVLESVSEDLGRSKLIIEEIAEENQALVTSLRDKTKESAKLALEVNNLKGSVESLNDKMAIERKLKSKLENIITDLTSQLDEKHCQFLDYDQQKAELSHVKKLVSDLELDKSRLCHLLSQSEECASVGKEYYEVQLSEMDEYLIALEVELTFTKTHYGSRIEELVQQLQSSDRLLLELREKHLSVETVLNHCLSSEVHYVEENSRLLKTTDSLRSELAALISQNRVLLDAKDVMAAELDKYKKKVANMEVDLCEDRKLLEVDQLKCMLARSEEEIENLMLSKEEDEVKVLAFIDKLNEQHASITLLEGYKDELMMQRSQYTELRQRLSEQILKTEEFKNLFIHLKELTEKTDAESLQACEEREPESPPIAMQDSLRIAFIKEQYETGLQELKQQLSISKMYSDEILRKLQNAIDEVENKKKCEASHLKRNEELGMKILELEAELRSVVSEKREKTNLYDRMKAKLECSLVSLESCKEEKQKLEASLQICLEDKTKIASELNSAKELLESPASSLNTHMDGKANPSYMNGDNSADDACFIPLHEVKHSSAFEKGQLVQDALLSRDLDEILNPEIVNQENLLHSNSKHLALLNSHFKGEILRSSMDHLNEELERMKNENSILSRNDHDSDQQFSSLESELMQLQKVESFDDINELKKRSSALETELKEMHDCYSQLSLQFAEVEGERQKLTMTLKNVRSSKKSKRLNRSLSAPLADS